MALGTQAACKKQVGLSVRWNPVDPQQQGRAEEPIFSGGISVDGAVSSWTNKLSRQLTKGTLGRRGRDCVCCNYTTILNQWLTVNVAGLPLRGWQWNSFTVLRLLSQQPLNHHSSCSEKQSLQLEAMQQEGGQELGAP